jgi:hypothetical protein
MRPYGGRCATIKETVLGAKHDDAIQKLGGELRHHHRLGSTIGHFVLAITSPTAGLLQGRSHARAIGAHSKQQGTTMTTTKIRIASAMLSSATLLFSAAAVHAGPPGAPGAAAAGKAHAATQNGRRVFAGPGWVGGPGGGLPVFTAAVAMQCNTSQYWAPQGMGYLNVVAMPNPGDAIAWATYSVSNYKPAGRVRPGGTDGGIEVTAGPDPGTTKIVEVIENFAGEQGEVDLTVTVNCAKNPPKNPPKDPPKNPPNNPPQYLPYWLTGIVETPPSLLVERRHGDGSDIPRGGQDDKRTSVKTDASDAPRTGNATRERSSVPASAKTQPTTERKTDKRESTTTARVKTDTRATALRGLRSHSVDMRRLPGQNAIAGLQHRAIPGLGGFPAASHIGGFAPLGALHSTRMMPTPFRGGPMRRL